MIYYYERFIQGHVCFIIIKVQISEPNSVFGERGTSMHPFIYFMIKRNILNPKKINFIVLK